MLFDNRCARLKNANRNNILWKIHGRLRLIFFFPKSHFSIISNIIDPLPSRSGKSSVEKSHPGSRCFVFDNIVVTSRRETGSYRTGPPLNLYCKSKRDTNVFYVDQIYIRFFVIFLNIGSEIDDVRQIRRKNTNGCNSDRD